MQVVGEPEPEGMAALIAITNRKTGEGLTFLGGNGLWTAHLFGWGTVSVCWLKLLRSKPKALGA